ncbi:hypothetical protein LTR37_013231 [Vermiconidia calcicola]|uniref:Uncharacterized protein n=1 Tax=Vermiconidia calcicola TaxID=1690605 RepID=A0ACC3MX01_9PEZI|nr:hypothetical protein LTR37_013231 [Vermiconidia calcicola]
MAERSLASMDCDQARAAREQANQECGLLRLAAELRNNIYDLALPRNQAFGVKSRNNFPRGLAHVCRAVRHDTLPMLYANSTIELHLDTDMNYFATRGLVRTLSADAIASLNTVMFRGSCGCRISHDIKVVIDRMAGEVRDERTIWKTFVTANCNSIAADRTTQLFCEIEKRGLIDKERVLRMQDLEEVMEVVRHF